MAPLKSAPFKVADKNVDLLKSRFLSSDEKTTFSALLTAKVESVRSTPSQVSSVKFISSGFSTSNEYSTLE